MRTLRWILTVTLLLGLGACGTKQQKLPQGLLGRWTTEAEDYSDRYFILSESAIVFATGESDFTVHLITRLETSQQGANPCYVVHYKADDGQDESLSFCHNPSSGEIRFQHQASVAWRKYRPPPPLAPAPTPAYQPE